MLSPTAWATICVAQFNRDSDKGDKVKRNERKRFLGQRPLYRKAELGGYAG